MDSDGKSSSELGMPTQARDVLEALEQDLSEAHPSSQSQSVMVAHADPGESGRVMGMAEIVDISTPRGVVRGSSATQVAPYLLPIWRDQECPDGGVHPQRAP